MGIGSTLFNNKGKFSLSSAFSRTANLTDAAELVLKEKYKELASLGSSRKCSRVDFCSFSSHLFHTTLNTALPNSCHSHWLELPHTWENLVPQPTTQTTQQRNKVKHKAWRVCSALEKISCWQSCGGLVPTTQAMVLVSCWLSLQSGWASIYLNYRFKSTAAPYLHEKYYLSCLFTDSRLFSSRSFRHSRGLPR